MSWLANVRADWGDPPAPIVALAAACDASRPVDVARRIGISRSAVSQLLSNNYAGNLERMLMTISSRLEAEMKVAASGGWGGAAPDWVQALAEACRRAPQADVGRRIGYSPAVVSQVVSGTYKGNLRRVEMQVRGTLMGAGIVCPTIGGDPIGLHVCVWNQELHFDRKRQMPGMSHRFRAVCPTCPNYLKGKGETS